MTDEIINRVANSKLKIIDLEEFYPKGQRIELDIKPWLFEGLVLREKEFRAYLETHNWQQYQDAYVAIDCSAEAIVPDWAYMLIAIKLNPYAKKTIKGTLESLETILFTEIIENLDLSEYNQMPVIIKGCSNKPVPINAPVLLSQKLQPVAKSIMFGEACSAVPLYKK